MRRSVLALAVAGLLAIPGAAMAQGFGIAARAGTMGIGAEAALGLSDALVIRGGLGLLPMKPTANISDIDFTLTLPKTWYNIGADLYLGSSFRIGAGMLFKPDDPTVEGTIDATKTVKIGNKTYTAQSEFKLDGTLDLKDQAPYVLIGFGKHTSSGVGLFLDLGVAFMGDVSIPPLTASGDPTIRNDAQFQTELENERQNIQDDAGTYLKYWPILNLGLRIGVG